MSSRVFYFPTMTAFVGVIGGTKFGTKYDLTHACQKCGSGATPQGPRYIEKKPKTKHKLFSISTSEILVDIELAQKLMSIGIHSLVEVYDQKNQKLPYMELRYQAQLPRFSEKTTGYVLSDQCSKCHRDGYYSADDPLKLLYENIDESITSNHILATFEIFGNSWKHDSLRSSIFPPPQPIFSGELAKSLEQENLSKLEFNEVVFI